MRIYTLQVHVTNPPTALDKLYHFTAYENLCREFERQVGRLENSGKAIVEKQEPMKDDSGEVTGGFKVMNAGGSLMIGSVYDYHVLDDDY